jgi:predicted RNA-binding Zn-ribbon protein involved in translation (DUF1610 family)
MTKTPELYCCKCQGPVQPMRGIVNYFCPKCGATFMASQIEQAVVDKAEECLPKERLSEERLSEERLSEDPAALATRG